MNTTTSVVGTGVVVLAGKWAGGEDITARLAIGGGFLAIALSLISQANEQIASRLALLVLVAAIFNYGTTIAFRAGLTKRQPKRWL